MGEQWPTDPEFRRFAAKVADAVTLAVANGYVITHKRRFVANHCCPMGAIRALHEDQAVMRSLAGLRYPGWALTQHEAQFAAGFDGRRGAAPDPYFLLGRAYRRRFIDKETT